MVTQNLRFSRFIAAASDRGLSVDDALEPIPFAEANIRLVTISNAAGEWVDCVVMEFATGAYELYAAHPCPLIEADVDFIKAILLDAYALAASQG